MNELCGNLACDHCGLPVPRGLVDPTGRHQFCCAGCRGVFEILACAGLEQFYRLREESAARPALVTGARYEAFDHPSFQEIYCDTEASGLRRVELYLEEVHCAACVWLVEKLPRLQPGVAEARLELARARATVRWDPRATSLSAIARRLDALGYPVHPYRGARAEELARAEDRRLLVRMTIAGAVAGNVMLLAFALYSAGASGMEESTRAFFRWVSMILTIPAMIWGGSVFFRGAWAALRNRYLHMDLPLSIGILTGFASGVVNTVRGAGEIYFDSVTVLIFLLLTGRYLLRKRQRSAAGAAELLFSLFPATARVLRSNEMERDGTASCAIDEVPVQSLAPGAIVEIRAGDTVPADGEVLWGASALDLALLTGESLPVRARPGTKLFAGTVDIESPLRMRVEFAGENTRAGRLLKRVEEEARRPARVVQLADRVSAHFVKIVLLIALGALAYWLRVDPARAPEILVALLVITCPCALGLATPLVVSTAIGRLARRGILVKRGDVFEKLAHAGRIWFDKTGTLTEGRPRVRWWHGDAELLGAVAAVERHSSHPVARALVESANAATLHEATGVRQFPGAGIEGVVLGRKIVAGSIGFAEARGCVIAREPRRELEEMERAGLTPIAIGLDGKIVAAAAVDDGVRADAAPALAALRALGWRTGILSGDRARVVAAVGERLGIAAADIAADATPENKLAWMKAEANRGVLVGDGVNDAAALAAAEVGIAVHGGAEAALVASDVFITRPGLAPIVDLIEASRHALRVLRWNIAFALFYNLSGATLAVCGLVDPLVAAILMPISSLTVIGNSMRAGRAERVTGGEVRVPEQHAPAALKARTA